MKPPVSAWLSLIIRIAVGAILFTAGYFKAVGPIAELAAALEAYHLLPASFISPLAMGLPWLEMWTGLFLMTGYATRWAAILSCFFFTSFIFFLGWAMTKGLDLTSCGCFGAHLSFKPKQTIVMDILCLAGSLYLSRKREPTFCSFDGLFAKKEV